MHILRISHPNFAKFSMHVADGVVLLSSCWNTLYTSFCGLCHV